MITDLFAADSDDSKCAGPGAGW